MEVREICGGEEVREMVRCGRYVEVREICGGEKDVGR